MGSFVRFIFVQCSFSVGKVTKFVTFLDMDTSWLPITIFYKCCCFYFGFATNSCLLCYEWLWMYPIHTWTSHFSKRN